MGRILTFVVLLKVAVIEIHEIADVFIGQHRLIVTRFGIKARIADLFDPVTSACHGYAAKGGEITGRIGRRIGELQNLAELKHLNERDPGERSGCGGHGIACKFTGDGIGYEGFVSSEIACSHSGSRDDHRGDGTGIEALGALACNDAKDVRKLRLSEQIPGFTYVCKGRILRTEAAACILDAEEQVVIDCYAVIRIIDRIFEQLGEGLGAIHIICRLHSGNKAGNADVFIS